jgi:hypothetical protein
MQVPQIQSQLCPDSFEFVRKQSKANNGTRSGQAVREIKQTSSRSRSHGRMYLVLADEALIAGGTWAPPRP